MSFILVDYSHNYIKLFLLKKIKIAIIDFSNRNH